MSRLDAGDRADHLEGELRDAVAEILQRQPLEDDHRGAAIGGCRRPAWPRSGCRRPASRRRHRCGRCRLDRSNGLPSAQTRPMRAIGPSHRPRRNWRNRNRCAWSCRCRRPCRRSRGCRSPPPRSASPRSPGRQCARGHRRAGSPRPRARSAARGRQAAAPSRVLVLAEESAVDGIAGKRAQRAPGGSADRPEQRADRRPRRLKDECGHG